MSFDEQPIELDEIDEEDQFLVAITEMVTNGDVSKARIHLRAYIRRVTGEEKEKSK